MPWETARKDPAYGRAPWKKARAAALRRAGGMCEIRGPGCTGTAVTVDHIHGLAADPQHQHLQAACQRCHNGKTQQESKLAQRHAQSEPALQRRTKW